MIKKMRMTGTRKPPERKCPGATAHQPTARQSPQAGNTFFVRDGNWGRARICWSRRHALYGV